MNKQTKRLRRKNQEFPETNNDIISETNRSGTLTKKWQKYRKKWNDQNKEIKRPLKLEKTKTQKVNEIKISKFKKNENEQDQE